MGKAQPYRIVLPSSLPGLGSVELPTPVGQEEIELARSGKRSIDPTNVREDALERIAKHYEPANAWHIDIVRAGLVNPVGGAINPLVLNMFTVPTQFTKAVIINLGYKANLPNAYGICIWRLMINGSTLPGYEFPVTISDVALFDITTCQPSVYIVIPQNAVFQVSIANTSILPLDTFYFKYRVRGWYE